MYFKQNSQIHSLPSGTRLNSSGNGAWYQVVISNSPNLIDLISPIGTDVRIEDPPGVGGAEATAREGAREGRRERAEERDCASKFGREVVL